MNLKKWLIDNGYWAYLNGELPNVQMRFYIETMKLQGISSDDIVMSAFSLSLGIPKDKLDVDMSHMPEQIVRDIVEGVEHVYGVYIGYWGCWNTIKDFMIMITTAISSIENLTMLRPSDYDGDPIDIGTKSLKNISIEQTDRNDNTDFSHLSPKYTRL